MNVGNVFGYDAYMICKDSLRNISEAGVTKGFAVDLRIANYRGYLLSQIEDIRLAIDDQWQEAVTLRFTVNGKTYTHDEMANETENRWGILDIATLTCLNGAGLSPGKYKVSVEEHIRASYIPMTAVASSSKFMIID